MSARETFPFDVDGFLAPFRQNVEVRSYGAVRTPQGQQRLLDLSIGVRNGVLQVDGRGRPVVFAGGMNRFWIPEGRDVFEDGLLGKTVRHAAPRIQRVSD